MNGQADVMGALESEAVKRSEADHALTVVAHQLLAIRAQVDAALTLVKRVMDDAEPQPRKTPTLPEVKEATGVHTFGPVGFRSFAGEPGAAPLNTKGD